MELSTIGQKNHPGREVPIWHKPQENLHPAARRRNRFRLILVETGTGILRINDQHIVFNAPVLLCLNEQEAPVLEQSVNIKATALYFHPSIVNDSFSLKRFASPPKLSQGLNGKMCCGWMSLWIAPLNATACSALAPSPPASSLNRLPTPHANSVQQRDLLWPCRSRSYFWSLLFTVDRLYHEPDLTEIGALSQLGTQKEIGEVAVLPAHALSRENQLERTRPSVSHTNRTTLTRQFAMSLGSQ